MPPQLAALLAQQPGGLAQGPGQKQYVVGPEVRHLCTRDWPLQEVQQVGGSYSPSSFGPTAAAAGATVDNAIGAAIYRLGGVGCSSRAWGDVVGVVEAQVAEWLNLASLVISSWGCSMSAM
jgi:hypothetical protein